MARPIRPRCPVPLVDDAVLGYGSYPAPGGGAEGRRRSANPPRARIEILMRLSHSPRFVGLRKLVALAASTLLALAHALPAAPPAPPAGTGTIKGKLVWAGGEIPSEKIDVKKGDDKVKDAICKA